MVELARIGSDPNEKWATRPMLRLWREVLAQTWTHWPVKAVISYGMPGLAGNIYRFDGWRLVRICKKASPGKSSWSGVSKTDSLADGRKSLWIFRYAEERIS